MALAFVLIGIVSFLLTLNLTAWVARAAARAGFLDQPRAHKKHDRAVPYGGGLAVAVGMTVSVLAGVLAIWLQAKFGLFVAFGEVQVHADGVFHRLPQLLAILLGGIAFMFVGLVDDKVGLSPSFRLAAEIIIAGGVAMTLEPLSVFLLLGDWVGAEWLGRIAAAVWIVVIANMFNLLDHYDGVCSGVACVAGLAFLCVALVTGQLFIAAFLAAFLGAASAFLCFNFPPSRMFLGDAGSLFIGYMLAVLCVLFTFYDQRYPLFSYLVPFAVLAVPMFDTAVVCLLRVRAGQSIFKGDRRHLAHRLEALGLSARGVVLVVYGLTLVSGIGALLLYEVDQNGALGVLAQVGVVLVIVTILERAGSRHE